ncbi:hypothetical protein HK104_007659 [Borealophlyctis nickersoniae]|nr:hypothetical protein HK104_007659 [Borealophlyctis nickersoniae]
MSQPKDDSPPLSAKEVASFASDYKTLRETKGHFDGGDYLKDVDGFGGKKHRALQALGTHLGQKGKPAADIIKTLGKPDEIIPKIDATNIGPKDVSGPDALSGGPGTGLQGMPGPYMGPGAPPPQAAGAENAQGSAYFLVYYWRGRHDFLWFEVDASGADEVVRNSGWYQAGE